MLYEAQTKPFADIDSKSIGYLHEKIRARYLLTLPTDEQTVLTNKQAIMPYTNQCCRVLPNASGK